MFLFHAVADASHLNRPPRAVKSSKLGSTPIPLAWRIGQGIALVLVALLAIYYHARGYRSIPPSPADARSLSDYIGFAVLAGFVVCTTPTAGIIATNTFQEALRRRWMTALLVLAIGFVMLAPNLSSFVQPGEELRSLRDIGIGFIILMTLLMAIFLGVAMVPPEIERRTILTILAKPVNRLEFLMGKFLGLCLTLLYNLVLMGGVFLLAYAFFAIRREGYQGAMAVVPQVHTGLKFDVLNLLNALILHFGQLVVMAALALTLSLIVSPITAIVFCFIAYFGGQMSSYWGHLGEGAHTAHDGEAGLPKPVQGILNAVYYVLPRLDRFDVRAQLVNDTPIGFQYVWAACGSGLLYVAVLLTIGYLVFSDREF